MTVPGALSLRRRSVLAGFGAALLLSATRPAFAAGGTTLRLGLTVVPTSVDPHFHNLGANVGPHSQIYETLVSELDGKVVPHLAQSWRQEGDDVWIFDLRPGVTFHDGQPFTAEDVIASIKRVAWVPNSAGSFMPQLSAIKEVSAPEPLVLKVETKGPAPFLLWQLAEVMIVRAKDGETETAKFNDGSAAVGTGPYKFKSFTQGTEFVVSRNDSWWGGAVDWAEVRCVQLGNDAARTAALMSGDVDLIDNVPHVNLKTLEGNKDITVHTSAPGSTYYLCLDGQREISPFSKGKDGKNPMLDVRVRRALSMAIDRDRLAERTLGGLGQGANQFIASWGEGYSDAINGQAYDPEGAKALLAEAGHAEGFEVTIHGSQGWVKEDAQLLLNIAQYWSRIGVKVQVETLPVATYLPRAREREFSVVFGSSLGMYGAHHLRGLVMTRNTDAGEGSLNRLLYSNPAVDDLLRKIYTEMDDAKRAALVVEATQLAVDDAEVLPIVFVASQWASRAPVGEVISNPRGRTSARLIKKA